MPESAGIVAASVLTAYNLIQNLVVTDEGYVPANLAVAAGLVALGRRSGLSWEELGLSRDHVRSGLIVGGSAAGVATAATLVATRIPGFRSVLRDERAKGHSRTRATFQTLVRFPLGTALFEEIAFRGVLDGLWRRRRGDRAARTVSAVAFGAWHLVPTYRLYPGMGLGSGRDPRERLWAAGSGALAAGASGLLFTTLRERAGSVVGPWIAHTAFNVTSYLAARWAWSLSDQTEPPRSMLAERPVS